MIERIERFWLKPNQDEGVHNVEVTTSEQSDFFGVGFDNLQDARLAALVATEYADYVENELRENVNSMLDDLINEIDSIVARHNKNVGRFKKNSAISQKLSDDDKTAINQLYSANINGIIGDVRNAIIDVINSFNGDDDGEEIWSGDNESSGDENVF